jgi:hypothetical protein
MILTVNNTGFYKHKQHFYGLSTDVKPSTANIGDSFTELNTGKEYLFDGTNWNTKLTYILNEMLAEQKTQADADADVITFSENIGAIEIYHAEATWQEFVVNGLTLTVPSGGYRTSIGGTPGKTVEIPNGVDCIVSRLV